jgi:fatty-acyl-CoA synthase
MSGYWRDPAATARALAGGWFHSGDRGHLDADGFLWIDGRLKDMIISGGENVSPAEVEAVLLESPDRSPRPRSSAARRALGRGRRRRGRARAGATLTRERVLALLDGRIARFKHPKHVLFVDALPRTALGKVRKEDVRGWSRGWRPRGAPPQPTGATA